MLCAIRDFFRRQIGDQLFRSGVGPEAVEPFAAGESFAVIDVERDEHVVARATEIAIAPGSAVKRIVPRAARERIIAGRAVENGVDRDVLGDHQLVVAARAIDSQPAVTRAAGVVDDFLPAGAVVGDV